MKKYTREEALEASIEYFGGDQLAAEVFVDKYALKNRELELLEKSPTQMHKRVAKALAAVEKKFPNPMSEKEIFGLIDHFKYVIPGGSSMFGIGNDYQIVSLSNCFVIDTVDSYGGICRADERIAQISKRRGGVGIDISVLRPKGMPTSNSALTTDGIIVFAERFSNTSREVAQSGRRGALMISNSIHHPEIRNFIHSKISLDKITGANISVRVTDNFMKAVKNNRKYKQRWPLEGEAQVHADVEAKPIWDDLINAVHKSAEPGILFWDNIINNSPADSYADLGFATVSTNPCGELPLCPHDSCRLLSINLTSFVENPFAEEAAFDFDKFREVIHKAQRLMDDIVELEIKSIRKIIKKVREDAEDPKVKSNELDLWREVEKKCKQGRRTGLGITGLGDCLAMVGIQYGSEESLKMVENIYMTLRDEAYRSSIEMAKERGPFPIFDAKLEQDNKFLNRLPDDIKKEMWRHGRRNIGILTTPPSGSQSVEAQVTSGFEPVFKAKYNRKRKLNENDHEKPDFVDDAGDRWKEYTVEHHGLKLFKEVTGKDFEDSPYNGSQAEEIDFMMRVKMQAIATKYVCHAISSTINLPEDISVEKVGEIYMAAHELGCKGLTIYRQNSRAGVLTDVNSTRSCDDCDTASRELVRLIQEGKRPSKVILSSAPSRPEIVECDIHRSKVGGGDWLFFVGVINGHPYEVFGGDMQEFTIPHKYRNGWIGKNGKVDGVTQYNIILGSLSDDNEKLEFKGIAKHFNNYEYGAFTRAISLSMRHGVPIKYICEQITKKGVEGDLFSFQRAMARVLKKYIAEGEKSGIECAKCGSTDVIYKNGCPVCMICGDSKCA